MSLYSFMGAPRGRRAAPRPGSRLASRSIGAQPPAATVPRCPTSQTGTDNREGRDPQRGQEQRVPRRHHPRGRARARPPRSRGVRPEGCRARLLDHRRGVRRRRAPPSSTRPTTCGASRDMVMKVKEPVAEEYHRLREGLTLFTYLHLAADEPLTKELVDTKVTSIAYETVQLPSGLLPLLYPMSEVAGCLAPQVGAHSMMKAQGGRRRADGRHRRRRQLQGRRHRRRRRRPERREHRARHGCRRHPARHRPRQAADELLALRQPGRARSPRRRCRSRSRCSAPTWSSAPC